MELAGGVVQESKAYDESAGVTKAPKTASGIRRVPIPAALVPLLERMKRDRVATELVVPALAGSSDDKRAGWIRRHLKTAGVERTRLFENTPTTMAVNFRSLRDSGITWLALAGVDIVKIQRRAGHDDVATRSAT